MTGASCALCSHVGAAAQAEVFSEVAPFINSVVDGAKVTIFAYGFAFAFDQRVHDRMSRRPVVRYGQTGSGKTYTMQGTASAPGLIKSAIMEVLL
jgi:hypothetical protein